MKLVIIYAAVMLFTACNTNQTKGDQGKTGDSSGTSSTDLSGNSGDTTVWAGSFAKWTSDEGEIFPGEYDTTNQVFVVCVSHVATKVDPSRVKFESGSCDNSNAPLRLALMVIKNDSARLLPGDLVAVDSAAGKLPTAVFKIDNQEKKVILNERQYSNIKNIRASRKVNAHLVQPQ